MKLALIDAMTASHARGLRYLMRMLYPTEPVYVTRGPLVYEEYATSDAALASGSCFYIYASSCQAEDSRIRLALSTAFPSSPCLA